MLCISLPLQNTQCWRCIADAISQLDQSLWTPASIGELLALFTVRHLSDDCQLACKTSRICKQSARSPCQCWSDCMHTASTSMGLDTWIDSRALNCCSPAHVLLQRSRKISFGFTVAYAFWVLLCARVDGKFLYPFLNTYPFPQVRCSSAQHPSCRKSLCWCWEQC